MKGGEGPSASEARLDSSGPARYPLIETAARNALDLDLAELFLHRLHLRLQLCRLLHHAEKISHQRIPCASLLIVAVGSLGRVVTASIGIRRLGGKLAHLDDLGAGKSRQHLLYPRVGF